MLKEKKRFLYLYFSILKYVSIVRCNYRLILRKYYLIKREKGLQINFPKDGAAILQERYNIKLFSLLKAIKWTARKKA